jgi:hypothetical protein
MSLVVLNALLILAGPFAVVLPLAIAARMQFAPPSRRLFRLPVLRLPVIRLAVAW